VAVFYRDDIKATKIMIKVSVSITTFEFICVKLQCFKTTFVVLLIYRPSSAPATNNFLSNLTSTLEPSQLLTATYLLMVTLT